MSLAPSTQNRRPRIDTGYVENEQEKDTRLSIEVTSTSPSSPKKSRLPALLVSRSPVDEKPPVSPSFAYRSQKASSRQNESRKLLAHVLDQLKHRAMPPTVYAGLGYLDEGTEDRRLGVILETVRGAVRMGAVRQEGRHGAQAAPEDDEDEEGERVHSTDVTFELMTQLRDVLNISVLQGWEIFADGSLHDDRRDSQRKSSPFRRSVNSLRPSGRRSRSPSPNPEQARALDLLTQCISVLSSVVLEDCRFKIASPRPLRPPNALQALTLEVARFLLHSHRDNPKIVSQLAFALIPAFGTFPPEMHSRLLAFFEECFMRGGLEHLSQLQIARDAPSLTNEGPQYPDDMDSSGPAMVSIRVDEAQDDSRYGPGSSSWVPWSSSASSDLQRKSTNAPRQPLSLYYLASLTPPLIASVLEHVDIASESNPRVEVLHRLHQLLQLIVNTKPDAYLDFLQVVAYHSPRARRAAASLLTVFWPKAVGHVTISKPFPASRYLDFASSLSRTHVPEDHPYAHQFVPWFFVPYSNQVSASGESQADCRGCTKPISGYGLLCPFCMCAVHFDCYDIPEGSRLVNYSMASDQNVKRIAIFRFSLTLQDRWDLGPRVIQKHRHLFRRVNLFTLSLCFVCRMPLWGCFMQGLKCTSCDRFVHPSCATSSNVPLCATSSIDSTYVTIQWAELRRSCVDFYSDILSMTEESIAARSYEEISIFSAVLGAQVRLMTNGIALGSIVIMQRGKSAAHSKEFRVDEFELQRLLGWCESHLRSETLPSSFAVEDYLRENGVDRVNHSMMYDWSNLIYISTFIKSPYTPPLPTARSSSDLLSVAQPEVFDDLESEAANYPFEVVTISHMRDALGYELGIQSDAAARLFLSHVHHLGFLNRKDMLPTLFDNQGPDKTTQCVFPLPLGLDLSADVETLFASVEASLAELDLSINEFGFLLLTRRLWPNGMASAYALQRLTRAILSWILAEDDNLAIILRDYVALQHTLPGVRPANVILPFPFEKNTRGVAPGSVNNGGDYVASRRSLLARYAAPWCQALHKQDPPAYAAVMYELCVEVAQESVAVRSPFSAEVSPEDSQRNDAEYHDNILRCIIRLSQNSVAFCVLDDLFVRWLESVSKSGIYLIPMPSLHRLFPREAEGSHRYSTIDSATLPMDRIGSSALDPWRLLVRVAYEGADGLSRSLQWLCVFACAGVDVPVATYLQFSSIIVDQKASLPESLLLVKAMIASTWLKSMGRNEIQAGISALHSHLLPRILESLKYGVDLSDVISFIRLSLATCLLLYGCERKKITELQLITEDETKDLPSRRKLNLRGSMVSDPIVIEAPIMNALEQYIVATNDDVSCMVAKFLNLFLTDSPFLETHEVDNFILRNGRMLCACAWEFYGVQRHEISGLRTTFLLRTLVVDPQPFRDHLEVMFKPNTEWELRVLAVARLFRIVLDVTSPAFYVDNRQWKSSVIDVFYNYFNTMWADEKEEVRLAAETFASTLLPAHYEAISGCWDEYLSKSPIAERIRLVSFLIQLRPHFPSWKVVSWDVIIETLREDQYDQKNGDDGDGPASAYLSMYGLSSQEEGGATPSSSSDSDTRPLSVSVLLLSLGMIADGVAIDFHTLLRIKEHLVRVLGFDNISLTPSVSGQTFFVEFGEAKEIPAVALPCVNELLLVLDAHYHLDLASLGLGLQGQDGTPAPLLVGSPYVDVSLRLFCTVVDLTLLPVLTLKALLETLSIIVYKHDFEKTLLRPLQQTLRRAVTRALELLLKDINFECRQQALSVVQAYIKRWHNSMGSFIQFSIEQVVKLIASQGHNSQDVLVAQAKLFVESTLVAYSNNGIFLGVIKRSLQPEFFIVLKQVVDANSKNASPTIEPLRVAILRDTLSRSAEIDQGAFQTVLDNLQSYVEVVHHQDYSAELMSFVGQNLTHLIRRASEWPPGSINPSPLLMMSAILIQHNKAQSRDMLSYTNTVLRVILNRLNVDTASLSRLIHVTASVYRKTHFADTNGAIMGIIPIIFEVLGDGLRMKARVLPATLKSMLEAIMTTEIPGSSTPAVMHVDQFLALAEPGFHFLLNHSWTDVHSEKDFAASLTVGKMILQAISREPGILARAVEEKTGRQSMNIRAWNILAFSALLDPSESWISIMYAQLPTFSVAHHAVLRAYVQDGLSLPESAITDINHTYIAIKLWLMLAHKKSARDNSGNVTAISVWNELWPPFESLVNLLETEVQAGNSMTLAMLTWSTVADLFLFLRALHSPVALQKSSQITILNRLRSLGRGESNTSKLTRTLTSMSEPPPNVAFDVMVNQAAKDIVAAEKLRVLEGRRDASRTVPERRGHGR